MKSGDPVTVAVGVNGWLCAAHARVRAFYESASRQAFYFAAGVIVSIEHITVSLDSARATGRFFDEEGITWIRGHQTGEAVVALLAAAALDVGAVPMEPFDSNDSSAGWYYKLDDYLEDDHPAYKDDIR
jgi:hypothetical protein